MKRYRVIFEESAQENVRESCDWAVVRGLGIGLVNCEARL